MFVHKDGPRHLLYELSTCVIVEFKESTFAEVTKWRTNVDQKNSFQLIHLRFCKVITIHKDQGMSIVPGKPFESVIVPFLKRTKRRILVQN